MADQIRTRPTARVVPLDPDDRVLMLRIHDPGAAGRMRLRGPQSWLLPGGGVKPGELLRSVLSGEFSADVEPVDVSPD